MSHLREEQLVLYRYGEADDAAAIERHVRDCAECRAELDALGRLFESVDRLPVPDRGEDYGRHVWKAIAPRLARRAPLSDRVRAWLTPRRLVPLGAVAALVVAAFFAGRSWQPTGDAEPRVAARSPEVRERILLVAVGDHLERSRRLLIELVNVEGADGDRPLDLTPQRQMADTLVASNRLYRRTAEGTGQQPLAQLLEELERLLVEIAAGPSTVEPAQLASLRKRIEDRGLLFRVRVLGEQTQRKTYQPIKSAASL